MRHDILFHITTRDNFKDHKTNANYEPESLEAEGIIRCVGGDQVKEVANRLFSGYGQILLLVIDVPTLRPNVKYEADEESGLRSPHICGPLNTDAIIDKIDIEAEKDGTFDISFKSFS